MTQLNKETFTQELVQLFNKYHIYIQKHSDYDGHDRHIGSYYEITLPNSGDSIPFNELIEEIKQNRQKYITITPQEKAKQEHLEYLSWLKENKETSNNLSQLAKQKGYNHNTIIQTPDFPNTNLRIGYGFVWSDLQEALVIGCTDENNNYYTAVPIYKPKTEWWAPIVDKN